MTATDKKKKMRQDALEKRAQIAATVNGEAASERLRDNFLSEFPAREGQSVAAYWPYRYEIDVRPLLERLDELGCNCLLPVVMGRREPLQFHQWKPGDFLEASRLGVLEPSKFHPSATPVMVILPLLAFDRQGNRLGYGGGYYDQTLQALRNKSDVSAIGVGYEEQEVETLPEEPQDQKLDAVVTDRAVLRFSGT